MLNRDDVLRSLERDGYVAAIVGIIHIAQGIGWDGKGILLVHFKVPVSEYEGRALTGNKGIANRFILVAELDVRTTLHCRHGSIEVDSDSAINRLIQWNNLCIIANCIDIYAWATCKIRFRINDSIEVNGVCINGETTS